MGVLQCFLQKIQLAKLLIHAYVCRNTAKKQYINRKTHALLRCPGQSEAPFGVVTISPTFHSKSPLPHYPPHHKPLKTPCKNQKSRTPLARPAPASTPAPSLRIRYRRGSWVSRLCAFSSSAIFILCVEIKCIRNIDGRNDKSGC